MKYPSVKSENFSWPSEVFFEQKESFQSIIFYLLISEKIFFVCPWNKFKFNLIIELILLDAIWKVVVDQKHFFLPILNSFIEGYLAEKELSLRSTN